MKTKSLLLSFVVLMFCTTSVADSQLQKSQRDSLVRIHGEFAAIEQMLVVLEKNKYSTASSDPTSGGVIFNYGVLLHEVRQQMAGIESHIKLLNSSPKWQRFTLE